MVDDDRARPPFGLRAFAWVVYNKRVNVGRRAKDRFGETGFGQGQRFARKPFQIAVFAHVHDRMSTHVVSEPEVESEVIVRWHKVGRMIRLRRIDVVAARRLDTDDDVSKTMDR